MFDGLRRIGQIHISVDDIDRAVGFYRDTLGMPFLFQVPGASMAFFDCDGVRLYLGKPEQPEFRSNALLYYRVADIHDAHQELRARGVEFIDEPHVVHRADDAELWMAFFHDSEGNNLALMADVPVTSAG